MREAIAIFCKAPRPGKVKTRLAEATSPAFAAMAAEAFMRDTLRKAEGKAASAYLVFAPAEASVYFHQLAGTAFQDVPQAEGDLGERLSAFSRAMVGSTCDALVILGSDSPTLPGKLIEQAFESLRSHDVVLVPATDGGYCLIGFSRQVPRAFSGIAWSSSTVLADTIAQLKQQACRLALLPPWYDVDTLDDWNFLLGHITALRQSGQDPDCPHTEALIGTADWRKM